MADPLCPRCDEPMVKRLNKQTREEFWGCADFPKCTGTRTITGAGQDDARDEMPSDRYRRADRERWRE